MRAVLALALALFPFSISQAVERPKIPAPSIDKQLLGDKTPRDFFRERAEAADCRKSLVDGKMAAVNAKEKLAQLLKDGATAKAIDAQEETALSERNRMLGFMAKCGECATREIERRVIQTAARTEVWYLSDGSCQLESTDAAQIKKSYERISDSLLRLKQYPKPSGGFFYVLEFLSVDHATGKHLPAVDKVESTPFHAFIGVRGPEIFGLKTSASYYVRNEYKILKDAQTESLSLLFEAERPVTSFRPPSIYEVTASGKKTETRQLRLSAVIGSWYVRSDGYLRYFTAADFGVSVQFAADLAHEILLDTVAALSERGVTQ